MCISVVGRWALIATADIDIRYDRPMRSFLHGAVQLHVLHHAAEHPIHGAWTAAELARHGYRISPGILHPTLHAWRPLGCSAAKTTWKQAGGCAATPSPTPAAKPWPRRAAPCANSATNSCHDPRAQQPLSDGVELAPVCASPTAATLEWRVRNPNAFPVNDNAEVQGVRQLRLGTVPAKSTITFTADRVAGTNNRPPVCWQPPGRLRHSLP